MALPKLNDIPKYDIVIPSTKVKTKFRPYLVKEEKLLLLAMEGQNEAEIAAAIIGLLVACVDDINDPLAITTYDMEYLFCQLRSKSVGETSTLSILCEDVTCETRTDVTIDISKASIPDNKFENMIELNDDITIEMKHLSYLNAQSEMLKDSNHSEVNLMRATTIQCIAAVHTENERIEFKNETPEAIEEFVDGMTSGQFAKLTAFVNDLPILQLDTTWKCSGCDKEQTMTLKGMNDFFQ